MSKIQIEKNVPLPEGLSAGRRGTYPWKDMEVGDSIVVPNAGATSAARHFGKRNNRNFTATQLDDGTYRVWRVADDAPAAIDVPEATQDS